MFKKGVSPVIATVLLIALTIAAMAIIISILVPFVQDNLDKSTECVTYEKQFSFDESTGLNCYSDASRLTAVSVKSNPNVDATSIPELEIVFSKLGGSKAKSVSPLIAGSTESEEIKMFTPSGSGLNPGRNLEIPIKGEVRTYVFNGGDKYTRAELYVKLKNGRICPKVDTIEIGDARCPAGTVQ